MGMKEIIILFKTHLDMGFTGSAEAVLANYCDFYIPKALETAFELKDSDTPFLWTTGSYLIWEYLRRSRGKKKRQMELAIQEGLVSWHGLPFTTHTELMNAELFQYGISLSRRLDQMYGVHTIAAKMSDVPGHTVQMVPILARNGIQFLHIGVNEACHMPEVPELFWWESAGGEKILVMYHSGYGGFAPLAGGEKAVCFAHTNDNAGPQSVEEIRRLYADLGRKYPGAYIHAGSLNDAAEMALEDRDCAPVFSREIGDTWIHGTGTDPAKIFWYRELLRTANFCDDGTKDKLYSHLLLIPEHTWGLDEKTFMPDHESFGREQFRTLRRTKEAKRMEASWQEQREYIRKAVDCLPSKLREETGRKLREYRREETDTAEWTEQDCSAGKISVGGWRVSFQENGAICGLEKGERRFADKFHLLGLLFYELFSETEYDQYLERYLILRPEWAIEDNKKIGLGKTVPEYRRIHVVRKEVYRKGDTLLVRMFFPEEDAEEYGCPKRAEYTLRFAEKELIFDLAWYQKQACRCPEALWFSMEPLDRLRSVSKLGKPVDVNRVCSFGNRRLHATDGQVWYENMEIELLDSCLLSAGGAALLNFENRLPRETDHPDRVDLNLYNNIWGTNFPMWYEEEARFRFILKTEGML